MGNIDKTYEFRPLDDSYERMTDEGEWIPDDGKWGMAFRQGNCIEYVWVAYKLNLDWAWDGGSWSRHEPRHPGGNAWHYAIDGNKFEKDAARIRGNHPNILAGKKAMNLTAKEQGGANGSGPEFHIGDPYISAGLVRDKETKEIIKFPEKLICLYCGDISNEVTEYLAKDGSDG